VPRCVSVGEWVPFLVVSLSRYRPGCCARRQVLLVLVLVRADFTFTFTPIGPSLPTAILRVSQKPVLSLSWSPVVVSYCSCALRPLSPCHALTRPRPSL
jgi:hypothetical protein